jgi:putative DNA primase/helicase
MSQTGLGNGHDVHELLELADAAPEWEPENAQELMAGHENGTAPASADLFPLTELGNAERLIAAHGADLLYCHPQSKWFTWQDTHWAEDTTGHVNLLAQNTVRATYSYAATMLNQAAAMPDSPARQDIAEMGENLSEWARKSESAAKLKAMEVLARSRPGVPVMPQDLDVGHQLLNLTNGTLRMEGGRMTNWDHGHMQLTPHRREDLNTKVARVAYDANAQCPTWLQFLDDIMAGDAEMISFLQQAVGYSITGLVHEHCMFILYGTGRNGKGTFINTLMAIVGDYAIKAPQELLMVKRGEVHPTELTMLHGARMVVVAETAEGRRLNEALVKELTGGDPITARRMREDFWTFQPTHKIWMCTNYKPVIRGQDPAIWARIRLVPFNVSFLGREDVTLLDRLLLELPGILNWSLEGNLNWQTVGLGTPPVVINATAGYRAEMDTFLEFIDETCTLDPAASVLRTTLLATYKNYCKDHKLRPLGRNNFYARVVALEGISESKAESARNFDGIGLGG